MFTTQSIKQIKNIWEKDEKTFIYCMELLKRKLDSLECYQFYIYYYIYNQEFEKAVEYLSDLHTKSLLSNIEFYDSDDFFSDLCCYIGADSCCDCTCDTCNECCCDEIGDSRCGECCGSCCCIYCTVGGICTMCECCCK